MVEVACFKKQEYGAVVATIHKSENQIVEVTQRNDGVYGLTIHVRNSVTDHWDDLTAYLKPGEFAVLGTVHDNMIANPGPISAPPVRLRPVQRVS